jgi:hypothetical protein
MSENCNYPCACRSANLFDVRSPEKVLDSYNLAAALVNVKAQSPDARCHHVGIQEVRKKDCRACAVYFFNCFDDENRCRKRNCKGSGDGSLLMFGLRLEQASKNKNAVTTSIKVEASPSKSLWIDAGDVDNERCVFEVGTKVIYPWYENIKLKNTWKEQIPIRIERRSDLVFGTINVGLVVSDGVAPIEQPISLQVIVPPDGIEQNNLVELEVPVPEPAISSIVLAKSVELLLQEGWEFFKKHGTSLGDNEIIALNIGSASFTEQSADKDAIARAADDAATKINVDRSPVLDGLNANLEILFVRKGALYETLAMVKGNDEVDIKVQIFHNDRKIEEIQGKIWKELKSTGQFSLNRKTSLNRPTQS